MAADLLRYSRRWGFGLEEVTTTVHLWHGEQDPKVLITVARQVAASLPRCQAHLGSGGHMMACDHAGDILTALTSAFEQDAKATDATGARGPSAGTWATKPGTLRTVPYKR